MKEMYNSSLNIILLYLTFLATNIYGKSTCGAVTPFKRGRIVNGQDLEYARKYPWYAALVSSTNTKQLVCGGTLIHERHILTAAHCFKPYFDSVSKKKILLEDIYVAKLGANNICINEEEVEIFETIKIHIHEDYYKNGQYFDIALMVLNEKATSFMPICLPPARYENNNRTNLKGSIIGLGKEGSNAWKLPCTVKEAVVPIQPDSVCDEMLRANNQKNVQNIFCAGYPEGKIDTCQGDSGGPFQVYRESSDSWMILGVTSFGYGCALPKFYGVYTDVSHYLDWIQNKIQYDENQNYVFELPSLDASNAQDDPSTIKKKRSTNWIINFLQSLTEI